MFDFDRIADSARRARDEADRRATWDDIEDAWDDTRDYLRDRVVDVLEPVYDWVERIVGAFFWVLEQVRVVYPVHFYRWITAGDERTCPECGRLNGATWEAGNAPALPPVHVNCRCRIVLAWTEWRTRYADEWRLRWRSWSEWEWRLTGWA